MGCDAWASIDWICDSIMTINLKFNYGPMYLTVQKESRDSRPVVLICNTSYKRTSSGNMPYVMKLPIMPNKFSVNTCVEVNRIRV